jgi:hypothetical protein
MRVRQNDRKLRCSATVKAWITEVSSIFWFTKIPLNVEEASCAREPLRPRVEKRFPQNKIWASPMRSRTKARRMSYPVSLPRNVARKADRRFRQTAPEGMASEEAET